MEEGGREGKDKQGRSLILGLAFHLYYYIQLIRSEPLESTYSQGEGNTGLEPQEVGIIETISRGCTLHTELFSHITGTPPHPYWI